MIHVSKAAAIGPVLKKLWVMGSLLLGLILCSFIGPQELLSQEFENNSIRVIRPRYFNKAQRFELGAQVSTIMNEAFIYTYMVSGLAAFHLNEEWAVEGAFGFGLNLDKSDKRLLFDEFGIKTYILRVSNYATAAVQWTPLYGKWQLSSGQLIYFDTYITAGGGMNGVSWLYSDFCEPPKEGGEPLPADAVVTYPTGLLGIGQRYFVSKSLSYKIDLRYNRIFYSFADQKCTTEASTESGTVGHDTVTLQLGASYYF